MWFMVFIKSSIGKKLLLASTGGLLLLFLVFHAFGNAAIYMGDRYFQIYADTLHNFPVLVMVFSGALLLLFITHISVGILLFLESYRERKGRYMIQERVVKDSFASRTMPYTGAFILIFLIIHVSGFSLFPPDDIPVSQVVKNYFSSFLYSFFYIFSFICLAIHLNHGFWSMLQTFGVNHPKFDGLIAKATIIVPLFFLFVFSGIPIFLITGS